MLEQRAELRVEHLNGLPFGDNNDPAVENSLEFNILRLSDGNLLGEVLNLTVELSESLFEGLSVSQGDFKFALESRSLGGFLVVEAFKFVYSLSEKRVVSLAFLELLLDEEEVSSGFLESGLELEDDHRLLLVILTEFNDEEITFLELTAEGVDLSIEELKLLGEVDELLFGGLSVTETDAELTFSLGSLGGFLVIGAFEFRDALSEGVDEILVFGDLDVALLELDDEDL